MNPGANRHELGAVEVPERDGAQGVAGGENGASVGLVCVPPPHPTGTAVSFGGNLGNLTGQLPDTAPVRKERSVMGPPS